MRPVFFNKEELLKNINLVIEKAKEAEALVVFVRDKDVASGEGKGFQVHQKINIPSASMIFNKKATNSFYGTGLLEYLKDNEIEHLLIIQGIRRSFILCSFEKVKKTCFNLHIITTDKKASYRPPNYN